jgi:hypothetical protein
MTAVASAARQSTRASCFATRLFHPAPAFFRGGVVVRCLRTGDFEIDRAADGRFVEVFWPERFWAEAVLVARDFEAGFFGEVFFEADFDFAGLA